MKENQQSNLYTTFKLKYGTENEKKDAEKESTVASGTWQSIIQLCSGK